MDMDRYIGRLLDNRYEILEVIGTGGMAVVYKARCHRLNRLVAIKILRAEYTQDEEFRRRFHAESQAVAMLSHPNIVSVYDVSTSNDADYIVMELIDGITLKQYMEKKGVLNWKETLHFAIQIGKALDHAHSRGIIHRDIKPHNVMVLKNGSVKVTDFGIARVMSKSNTLTKEALGSVHYISPEQAKGGRVDNRSDIYSLGVVMYEMMTGRPPYDGESPVAVAIQHINGKPVMPSVLNPNIPGGLEQIIMRAMSHEPGDRYSTAAAMLQDMDEFRKNPSILFDYNNPNPDLDAATRLKPQPKDLDETMPLPKTVAERTAAKQAPTPMPRRETPPRPKQPQQKPARRREQIVEEREERSKVATISIIACATVALAAIILFCVAVFGGTGESDNVITVPNLLGMDYELAQSQYPDIVFKLGDRKHSDEYAKGQIMKQSLTSGKKMMKGETITVTVSYGPEPKEKVMEDLSNVPQQQAQEFLDNMQLGLKYLPKMENSSTVAAGCVIRTDPAKGEKLEQGQTVTLWISTGPVQQKAKVPYVMGRSLEMAKKLLIGSGFNNFEVEEVESTQQAGIVVEQSIMADTEVDVTTLLILKVSKGSQNPDHTNPMDPIIPDTYVEKTVTIQLPNELTADAVLTIWREDQLMEERPVFAGTVSVEVKLMGEGKMTFTAMLDEDPATAWIIVVDFDAKDNGNTNTGTTGGNTGATGTAGTTGQNGKADD